MTTTNRVHDGGSRRRFTRGFTTRVHDEGSHGGSQTVVHNGGSPSRTRVRAERAGWLGAPSELRDGGSLKNGLVAGPIVAGPSFATSERLTPLPNRLGADVRISPAGGGSSGALRRDRFSAQRSGRPETTGSIGRTNRHGQGGSRRGFTTRVHTTVRTEDHATRTCQASRHSDSGWGSRAVVRDGRRRGQASGVRLRSAAAALRGRA